MKVATDVLAQFIELTEDPATLRNLMDDTGLEVKRVHLDGPRTTYNLELLANRGDHHAYDGIARELALRLDREVRMPPVRPLESGEGPIAVQNHTDLCYRYSATLLSRSGEGEIPAAALRILEAAEIHSISNTVDATNICNLEMGQPTHVFDRNKVSGTIHIRTSVAGETAWPLFHEESIELPEGTLVIADDEKILAIAGVIGCEDSKADEHSTEIILESAAFDPVTVRKASRALNIHTDSSARFERGSDPERILVGAGRVVELLSHAGWETHGVSTVVGEWTNPHRVVELNCERARQFMDVALTDEDIANILHRAGFITTAKADHLAVEVPSWRLPDVRFEADLHEELLKAIGYNETPISLPPVELGAVPSADELRKHAVSEVLLGQGFYEVITDGFYGRPLRDKLGFTEGHPLYPHVETTNALDRAYSLLKNNCLGQAVELVAYNLRHKVADIKAYEWTTTFHPTHKGTADNRRQSPAHEVPRLWAIACGQERPDSWDGVSRAADAMFLKGLVEELAMTTHLPLQLSRQPHPLQSALHTNRQATIELHGEVVGVLGEIHPSVLDAFKIKRARPVYIELLQSALLKTGTRPVYIEAASTHPIERSLAFTLPHKVAASEVQSALQVAGPEWLSSVDITDIYAHQEDGQPVRTLTYGLSFSTEGVDRSAEEVNQHCEAMISAVVDTLGQRGVKLRG